MDILNLGARTLWPGLQVRLATPLKMDPERPEYHRATLYYGPPPPGLAQQQQQQEQGGAPAAGAGCDWWAISTGNQISSRLLSARYVQSTHTASGAQS
jgi:hypothetical protein